MATLLVLHASQEGQTQKIADYIGETLRDEGHEVAVQPLETPPALTIFDAVIIGASIHIGAYPDALSRYVKMHLASLNALPSAFFSVCLTAATQDEEHVQRALGYIDSLLDETQWRPALTASFAGALKFSEYGFFKRRLMKSVAKQDDLIPDAQHDYEFTDWDRVTVFAQDFLGKIETAPSAP